MYIPAHRSRMQPVFSPTPKITKEHLLSVIKLILNALPTKEMIPQAIVKKMVSIEEAIMQLSERIKNNLTMRFKDLSHSKSQKVEIIVSFLAVLELIRRGAILVTQRTHFGDIEMMHKNDELASS